MALVSIIIPCKNEGDLIRQTIESILETPSNIPYDITVINDASTDNCCSFLQSGRAFPQVKLINTTGIGSANARNLGAQQSVGDILVFCDAHITVAEGWLEAMADGVINRKVGAISPGIATMTDPAAVGYGMSWDEEMKIIWLHHPSKIAEIPIAPGGCMAVCRKVFQDVGGFDRGFKVYGYEDAEFSLKLWLFGYRVEVDPSVVVRHYFRTSHPYPITMSQYAYNAIRMAISHFNTKRLGEVIEMNADLESIGQIIAELILESDAIKQREYYFSRRKNDDDWFMQRFAIPI